MAVNPYGLYDYQPQEPQGDKAATPQNFVPQYNKEQIQGIINNYKQAPTAFKQQDIEKIKQHAIYHNVGFYEGDFQITEAIKQFMGGVVEGFSTYNGVDAPDNEYEAIARDVGHLLGFAPGLAARPLKYLGLRNTAAKLAGKESIPLMIGSKATNLTSKFLSKNIPSARADATSLTSKFLTSGAVKSVAEESMKLAVASAASNWKQGVDGMIEAAKGGAEFGGAFQILANLVPGSGPFKYILRATAGSIYQGMHAEAAGATTPEKVYEYLLGAYFGGGATGWVQKDKGQFFKERNEQMYGSKGEKADNKLLASGDPTLVKTWEKYDRIVQKEIIKDMNDPKSENWKGEYALKDGVKTYPEQTAMLEHLVKSMGIDTKLETVSDNGWQRFNRMQQDAIVGAKPTNLALKTEKELNELNVEKKQLAEKIQKTDIDLLKQKGADRILTQTESLKMKQRLEEIDVREKELLDLKPFQWLDKDKNIQNERANDDGNDIGMISNRDLTKKSETLVNKHLKKIWDKDDFDPIDKRNEVLRLTSTIDNILQQDKYFKPEQKVDTKELVKEIKETLKKEEDIDLKTNSKEWIETENDLRQHLTRRNFSKPVKYINMTVDNSGEISEIGLRTDGFTNAGNRKDSIEPKKEVQRILEQELNLKQGEEVPEASIILDNMTFRGSKGEFIDGTLSDVRKIISNVKGRKAKKARELYETLLRNTHKKMEEDGYYPFGGKGDNDIIIYIKKHPNLSKIGSKTKIENYVTELKKELKNGKYYDSAIKRNKYFSTKEAKEQYISNIMWDLSLNGFKPETAAEYKTALDKLFKGEGYIKNATAWNKRQQIWFTPTFRADKDFVNNSYKEYIDRLSKVDKDDINSNFNKSIEEGKVNYAIVRDLDPALFKLVNAKLERIKKLDKTSKNTEMDEHVDGMILVEDNVLKAIIKDSGMPESGQSKSFIVSPDGQMGALLGKYMMHSVGPKASRQMRKSGLHMIMQESAVKQRGERKITDYKIENDALKIDDPNAIYRLPLEHIKYSYSVKNNDAMIGLNPNGSTHKHGIPKQLLMAMTQNTFESFPKEMVQDFFNETVYKKYRGNKDINEVYDDYKNNPKSKKLLNLLEKNVEDLGIDKLLDAINENPTNFSDAAYMRLMKIQREDIQHKVADGELSHQEAERLTENMGEFNSAMDRIVEAGQTWKAREQLLGREGNINPLLFHKWIRPYRFQVIRNYVFNSLSRPKVSNSGVARMRGYDKWFQQDKNFADLETNDEIFYLDDAFKRMPLKTNIKSFKDTTLGELWFEYKNFGKKKREQADNVFTALTVRVPMDSVSGAQRMSFKGFTGRPGHGVLMHGRAMKAEGGADLDGDESFIFFGGREGEKGGGFRKEWIDKFHENKEEFYEPDGSIYNNKNKEVTKSLTMQDSKETTGITPEARDSKMWQYDSQWRQDISERAVDGRNLLGGAVSSAQVLKAAHSSLLSLRGQKNIFTVFRGKKKFNVELEARTDAEELKKARQLASSMIAFTSDPLDVAGLTGYNDYVSKLNNAYFKAKINGKEVEINKDNLRIIEAKEGIVGQMRDINSALYSRDYNNNKSWDVVDINQKTSVLKEDSRSALRNSQSHNGMLTKIGRLAADVELYDSPFRNISPERLVAMYQDYNEISQKIPLYKDLLDNIKVTPNKLTFKIMDVKFKDGKVVQGNKRLYEQSELERVADNLPKFYEYINHPQSKFRPGGGERSSYNENIAKLSRQYRIDKLKELVKTSEDFLTQDVSDMVSVRQLYRYYDGVEVNSTLFKKILKTVNQLKVNSYLQRKNLTEEAQQDRVEKRILKSFGVADLEAPKKTATLDQAKIDVEIAKARQSMPNPRAKKIFDMMMLGTFKHSTMETGINKLGFSSKAIDNKSLTDYVGDYTQVMTKGYSKKPLDTKIDDTIFKDIRFEKDLPEGTILEDTTTGYEQLHGKPDMKKLPKEIRQEVTELVDQMKSYNGKIGQNLNLIVRDLLGKDFNAMNYSDIKTLNRYFKELKSGTIWQKLFKEKTPELRKRYTMQFPMTINRETMKYDIATMKKRGLFVTKAGEVASGDMLRLTNITEKLHHGITLSMDKAQAKGDEEVFKLRRNLEFLDGIEEGEAFRRVAVRKIETDGNVSRALGRTDKAGKVWANDYIKSLKKEIKDTNYDIIDKNRYRITERLDDGTVKRIEMTGADLVKKTKDVYVKHFKDMHKIIRGNEELLESYHKKTKLGKKLYHDYADYRKLDDPINGGKRKSPMEPIYDYSKFVKDIYNSYERGLDITTELGVDGMRAMARSMMITLHNKYKQKHTSLEEFRKRISLTLPTGEIADGYWPHMFFDKTLASNALRAAAKKIDASNASPQEKSEQKRRLQLRSLTLTGDWINGTENWDAYDGVNTPKNLKDKKYNKISWKESLSMTGPMHKRTSHIPGHSIDATVAETYTRNLYRTYYKQLAQILSRKTLVDFDQRAFKLGWGKIKAGKYGRSLKDRWHDFYSLYVQDALGHPTVVPEYILKDPAMKIKGTPYAWWADNNVTNKLNSIAKKVGLKEPIKGKGRYDINDVRNWSNLEARFELMALLAHPKSVVTNLFGGSLHTIQSAGASALKKVYDYGFLKQINPDFTSRQKIKDFAISQGVFPEMLAHEWGMQKTLQGTKSKGFVKEMVESVSKEGTVNPQKLRELADKHNITKPMMEFAAKFMSKPEIKLRTDAFMAHYIKAWERFGGAITQHDHPFLIEMAKKGVKATQFLYDSVNRPAFARTGLGKIMTRFQLWSWNAWRFRNDVNREARIRGYGIGTPEYEKFKRTASIDLMVYALGSVYAMSLFENAIPAPYNHLKETSEWLFGDDKERERAFWGLYPRSIAPLQAITPPVVSRVVEGLKAMSNNEYDKFLDYHLYTFMPFGRVARDFSPFASGNLIDNPYRAIEKLTGLPYGAVQRDRSKYKEQMAYHPTFNKSSQLRQLIED